MKKFQKRILVAPLNWGLGHATRCIPIINQLIRFDYIPIIASDGNALKLLKKEFPQLDTIELPSYNIEYAKKGKYLKFKLLKNSPKMLKAITKEKSLIKSLVKSNKIHGIISDNRFGVYHKNIPSVFITHQLKVMSGKTTWLTTKAHERIISKFDECWIPDNYGKHNLSGELSHSESLKIPLRYLGPISRFKKEKRDLKFDVMVLLSGPEPQRTLLEQKLFEEVKNYTGNVLFIRGVVEEKQENYNEGNALIYNFMTSSQLQDALNESRIVLCRSGYTTIMDLAKVGKKAFFIPTPGQFEQEYLAKRLTKLNLVPSCNQDYFTINKLEMVDNYDGLNDFEVEVNYKKLFSLFECE